MGVADLIVKLIESPKRSTRSNLGVNKPSTDGDKPSFLWKCAGWKLGCHGGVEQVVGIRTAKRPSVSATQLRLDA
jgi:hypothetical protein